MSLNALFFIWLSNLCVVLWKIIYIWLGNNSGYRCFQYNIFVQCRQNHNSIPKMPCFYTPPYYFSTKVHDTMGDIDEKKMAMNNSFYGFGCSFPPPLAWHTDQRQYQGSYQNIFLHLSIVISGFLDLVIYFGVVNCLVQFFFI